MSDDIPMTRCLIRGFIGSQMLVEQDILVESRRVACEYVMAYFDNEASWSGCERYTVDMSWVE